MSYSSALTKAKALKAVMLKHGVPEVSIELQAGRPNSYDPYDGLFIVADMSHHTVSSYSSSSLTPVLKLCKTGRVDVPGPLCNGYGGWDLTYRILCFSYANHPGAGGSYTVPRAGGGGYTIPRDSARRYAWGTEYEGGIREADWDRMLTNPRNGKRMTFREFMGRSNAAIQDYFNLPRGAHMEHATWTTRKIDRLRYSKQDGIDEINKYDDAPTGDWFDMADVADLKKAIREVLDEGGQVDRYDPDTGKNQPDAYSINNTLYWIHRHGREARDEVVQRIKGDDDKERTIKQNSEYARRNSRDSLTNQAVQLTKLSAIQAAAGVDVDEAEVAQQVAALLVPAVVASLSGVVSLTEQQVQDAAERAIREVLGSVDE